MSHTPPWGNAVDAEPEAPKPSPYPELTERELDVAQAIARGIPNREIAKALGLSVKTVDSHRAHALKKLGCKNNVALVKRMIRDGVVTP